MNRKHAKQIKVRLSSERAETLTIEENKKFHFRNFQLLLCISNDKRKNMSVFITRCLQRKPFFYRMITDFEDSKRERKWKRKYDKQSALVEGRFVCLLSVERRKWVNTDDRTTSERIEGNKAKIWEPSSRKVVSDTTKIFLSSFRI